MNKYLPSKKFVRFIGIVGIMAILVWVISMVSSKRQIFNSKDAASAMPQDGTVDLYQQDSDDDGIYDWEEGLWATNPHDKDSDADGISDGDEIAAKKSEIQEKNNLSAEADSLSDAPNQTEAFARQLLSTASLAEQQGGLSQEAMDNFSESIGVSIASANIADQYTLADIRLSSVSNTTYKASLAVAFSEYRAANISELEVLYRFANGDVSAEADLDRLVAIYLKLSAELLKTETPHAIAGTQLVMINTAGKLAIVFQSMKALTDDPLVAVTGFKQYQQYSAEMQVAILRLTAYFNSSGV